MGDKWKNTIGKTKNLKFKKTVFGAFHKKTLTKLTENLVKVFYCRNFYTQYQSWP